MQIKDLSEWESYLQPIIDDMRGRPLNIHALLANHPALLQAWWPLRMYLVNGGELSQRDCELVILRTAVFVQNDYEWASHVVRGLDSGLSKSEIDAVRDRDAAWPAPDEVLLRAVDELSRDHGIAATTLAELQTHFSDQQILDVIHVHGMYLTLGGVLNTWEVALDTHVAEQLPAAHC